jgi:branched-chain amino acid transport system substrate-binding protein
MGDTCRRGRSRVRRTPALMVSVATVALVAAACGSSSSSSSNTTASSGSAAASTAKPPLVIGISLSKTGDFSDPGSAAEKGYQLWADTVNAKGGILGRQVQLKIADDASSPDQAVTNYTNFITKDKVDLVFGPFSTLLTAPSARVANRFGYAFVEPAGGGPKVFDEKLGNVFFVQPAPVINCADPLVTWVLSLPADQRPKTAAYPTLDDPFAAPIVDRARMAFEKAGIKTVYKTVYPPETADMTPIVQAMAAKNPDMVVSGTQSTDAYAEVKSMIQLKFNPKVLFFSDGASSPVEFPDKVGAQNTEGIASCAAWFPTGTATGNQQFVQAYNAKYGGTPNDIDGTSAEAYSVGQLIEDVAQKTGKVDNQTIISALHAGAWPTIQGNLSWDQYGAPTGTVDLIQWVSQKLVPVYPPAVAQATPVFPKPAWPS